MKKNTVRWGHRGEGADDREGFSGEGTFEQILEFSKSTHYVITGTTDIWQDPKGLFGLKQHHTMTIRWEPSIAQPYWVLKIIANILFLPLGWQKFSKVHRRGEGIRTHKKENSEIYACLVIMKSDGQVTILDPSTDRQEVSTLNA